jgi:LuxR family transcriptional regulator, maltose regulon positive regulatory protein
MIEGVVQIPVGRRRIIKRPRLTRLLDDSNARLILLVAPAGYGKTTLARQWLALGPRRHAWYTATAPSADVSALALGLGRVLETVVPGPAERMRQRLLAVPASEEEPELVAEILADSASAWPDEAWLVVDDYHHVGVSRNADAFFARLLQASGIRLVLTSRTDPAWASAKQTTYGEIAVLGAGELALTPTESAAVLGAKCDDSLAALLEATQGWPVVTGLAAVTGGSVVPELPSAEALYDFLAVEVFNTASIETRALLCRLAFVSTPTLDLARRLTDIETVDQLLEEAERLGLVEREHAELRLHPLLRDFLKGRFAEYPAEEREEALALLTEPLQADHAWDDLFELVKQDPTPARLDALIAAALRELVTEDRLGTLVAWCDFAEQHRIQTPSIQLALAELNLSHGTPPAALPLARGAAGALGDDHSLASRAWIVAGRSAYFLDDYAEAVRHFGRAGDIASNEEDRFEALWGHFLAAESMETFDPDAALAALEPIASAGLDGMLRYTNACTMIAERFGGVGSNLEAALALVPFARQARNVAIRTSFLNGVGRALLEQARYDEGFTILQTEAELADKLGLRFILPNALIGLAIAEHGRRRFGRESTLLRRAETEARACGDMHNLVECEILRIRMSIALGAFDDAIADHVSWSREPGSIALGEVTACRALAHACAGEFDRAEELIETSRRYVEVTQTRVLRASTLLIIALGRSLPIGPIRDSLVEVVDETGSIDHLVTACRGVPALVPILCSSPKFEPTLTAALRRSRDFPILAWPGRRPGLASSTPGPALSPREEEVFALLSRGLSNKQIARPLFISEATVKVHLRHIYRKLGVTTRLEAVARGPADLGQDS